MDNKDKKNKNSQSGQTASDKAWEKISRGNFRPLPMAYFLTVRLFLWLVAILTLVLGGLALSLVAHLLMDHDWFSLSRELIAWSRIFFFIPYAWVLAMVLFYAIAYLNFRHFPRAYKYTANQLLTFIFIGSAVFGLILSATGLPAKWHNQVSQQLPEYRRLFDNRWRLWHNPGKGTLTGQVVGRRNGHWELRDFKNQSWEIRMDMDEDRIRSSWGPGTDWQISGRRQNKRIFIAEELHPWPRPGMGRGFFLELFWSDRPAGFEYLIDHNN